MPARASLEALKAAVVRRIDELAGDGDDARVALSEAAGRIASERGIRFSEALDRVREQNPELIEAVALQSGRWVRRGGR